MRLLSQDNLIKQEEFEIIVNYNIIDISQLKFATDKNNKIDTIYTLKSYLKNILDLFLIHLSMT